MKSIFAQSMRETLLLVIVITGLCGLVQVAVQQQYRLSANDPQVQLAQDAARLLAGGVAASAIVPPHAAVDIAESLSPWVVIYDIQGAPIASSGLLHNVVPQVPSGVFTYVSSHREDRITWEPEPGVRQAVVAVAAKDKGFVVAGRNLREVESRETGLSTMVLAVWAVLVGLVFIFGRLLRR
jgi:hypothetical protein